MKIKLMSIVFVLMLFLAACGSGNEEASNENSEADSSEETEQGTEEPAGEPGVYPQLSEEAGENEPVVEMTTSKGVITIKLFPEYAPKTVENFLTHSKDGYYDGVTFHRVMNEFMIQGGDPEGTGAGGESIYGESFEDEFSESLFNLRGALSMANAGPDTNGSQFFIVQNTKADESLIGQMTEAGYPEEIIQAYEENGGTPHLDNAHTVFGQVIDGMDVVDEIAAVEVDPQSSKPNEDVIIESIKVTKE
ncbi:peptidylprolyl isomerase [Jeotgalibacillus sp. S-D1]|uniref:peptidylprolyl isomerase n=1 Tax=Jeotgalibacillus sp. S-D1 TaxID=2552189 RepID=UPI0010592987|nr:peptidylprolyl isomerase [Jeotgalibacillus sp. S-D1]TDL30371.1 peptidylprolyl isomerase [Jeotgalibacillus sp. S-D1]